MAFLKKNPEKSFLLAMIGAILLGLSFTAMDSPRHDYEVYIDLWQTIVDGNDPWSHPKNSYGPTYNLIAWIYAIHPSAPRVLFALMWFGVAINMASFIRENQDVPSLHKYGLYLFLLFNPLFWAFVIIFPTNDIFMAFFIVLAIMFFHSGRESISAGAMAIAVAVKFIPIVMVPFFILSRYRIRWQYTISFILSTSLLFGISFLRWGENIFYPFLRGYGRQSKILSIFRFLRGEYSPLALLTDDPNVDRLSIPFALLALVLLFGLYFFFDLDKSLSSIIAFVLLLTLYNVGHHQFHITSTLLLIWWLNQNYKQVAALRPQLIYSMGGYMSWIAFASLTYVITRHYSLVPSWRELLGLPTFLISVWLLLDLIRFAFMQKNEPAIRNVRV